MINVVFMWVIHIHFKVDTLGVGSEQIDSHVAGVKAKQKSARVALIKPPIGVVQDDSGLGFAQEDIHR